MAGAWLIHPSLKNLEGYVRSTLSHNSTHITQDQDMENKSVDLAAKLAETAKSLRKHSTRNHGPYCLTVQGPRAEL